MVWRGSAGGWSFSISDVQKHHQHSRHLQSSDFEDMPREVPSCTDCLVPSMA